MTTELDNLLAVFREVDRGLAADTRNVEVVVTALRALGLDPSLETFLLGVLVGGQDLTRTAVQVDIPVTDLDRAHAQKVVNLYFDPRNWPGLLPERWKAMTPVDQGPASASLGVGECRRYQEVFRVTDWLQLTPVLEFCRTDLVPGSAELAQALEYRLVESEVNEDDVVRRDAGAIVAHFVDGVLRIRTTKRIRFRPPFDGPGLTMFAGVLGYLEASQQMVQAAVDQVAKAPAGDGGDVHDPAAR